MDVGTLAERASVSRCCLRTPGFHRGEHFVRVESAAALALELAELPGSAVAAAEVTGD